MKQNGKIVCGIVFSGVRLFAGYARLLCAQHKRKPVPDDVRRNRAERKHDSGNHRGDGKGNGHADGVRANHEAVYLETYARRRTVQCQYRDRVLRKQPQNPAQWRRKHRGKNHHHASGKAAYVTQRDIVSHPYEVYINFAVKHGAEQRDRYAADNAGARRKQETGGGSWL